jgi:uncharacterized protein (TIGR00255 family)
MLPSSVMAISPVIRPRAVRVSSTSNREIPAVLLSMTGYGEAHRHEEGLAIAVEARTINNRHFKISLRTGEGFNALEPQLEQVVRRYVHRGTVQLNLKIDRESAADAYRFNEAVLKSYVNQLDRLFPQAGVVANPPLAGLLPLPGVVDESSVAKLELDKYWPAVEATVVEAMDRLAAMRAEEGRAMTDDLLSNLDLIAGETEKIAAQAPVVVESYRQRLTDRMNRLLEQHEVKVGDVDLIREIGVFADRCDISEEVVRLRSHLAQFREMMQQKEPGGKKLEFITQEMFRETNTIGSKANDADIARFVIEIKTAIERVREMIQNIE